MSLYATNRSGGGGGSGVTVYANLAAFPATAANGTLAVAGDTNILYEYYSSIPGWEPIASNASYVGGTGGVTSIGTLDSEGSPSSNAATITSNALILQSASATAPGVINNSTQTISGVKTFSSAPNLSSLTASKALVLDGSKNVTTLTYSNTISNSSLVSRDSSGNFLVNTQSYYDNTQYPASTAFVKQAVADALATVPLSISGGTYSFASLGTTVVLSYTAVAGTITAIGAVLNGGTGFLIGDIVTVNSGNHDSYILVTGASGGAATSVSILYGGSGYTSSTGGSTVPAIPGSLTFTLTGVLATDATFIMPNGTYLLASSKWVFNNNTTGSHNVRVYISNGSDGTTGSGVLIPQGSNNSTATFVTTDGVTDVWYVNAPVVTLSTSANSTFYPLFVPSSTNGGQLAELNTSLTFNPSTGNLATTSISMGGAITMNSNQIHTLTDPTAAQDAATKNYVDTVVAALNPTSSVLAATTSAANTSSYTYNNGVAGVGATLTGPNNTALTVDGFTFTAVGQRILVKNDTQSPSGAFNGIYSVTQVQGASQGVILTRAVDYNTPADMNAAGLIPVINGTTQALSSWNQTSTIVTVGTTPLVFQEFTANPSLYLLKTNNLNDVASANTSFNNISPMTTKGDIIYEDATPTAVRLPIGSTGNVLTVSGGVPVWSAPATSGTVTAVSVNSSNGFTGSSSGGATPALTLATSVTGIVKGNGTALSAATTTAHNVLIGAGAADFTNVAPSATSGVALVSGGSSADPSFGQLDVSSSSAVKNALAIANGGTGQTSKAAAFDALSPSTTKGDTIIYSTTNARQAVPNDYGALIPDSSQTNGWRSASYTQTLNGKPGKNYIQYADFENNATTGWTLGTIGARTNGLPTGSPTFGSGASGNLSIAATSSSIAGAYSLNYVSSAATTAGDMVASSSYAIDTEDQAKVLTVRFYYSAASGAANCNFSGTSSNSYAWAVYDVTNSSWLTSAGNFNLIQSSGSGYVTGTVQTNATTANIRLCVYNANATSGAATLTLDDFYVGPQTAPLAPAMSDYTSWTPTGTWSTNTTYTGWFKRTGDSLSLIVKLALAGAPTSASLTVTLPNGYNIDTTKLPGTPANQPLGIVTGQGAAHTFSGVAFYSSATTVGLFYTLDGSTASIMSYAAITQAAPYTFANSDYIYAQIDNIPISGWSSNAVASSDTDTRVVAARMKNSSTSMSSGVDTKFVFATIDYDTHAAINGSKDTFTVPVTGYYRVSACIAAGPNIAQTVNNQSNLVLYKNGSAVADIASSTSTGSYTSRIGMSGSTEVQCNAGDTLQLYGNYPGTAAPSNSDSAQWITFERLSGPAVITATESVNAQYTSSSSSFASGAAEAAIVMPTKVFDSHNAYNTSTGVYTAPVSGKYQVSCTIAHNSATWASTARAVMIVNVNGSDRTTLMRFCWMGTATSASCTPGMTGSGLVSLTAGDTLKIVYTQNSGSTQTLSGDANDDSFSICRVGN